ncbi:MAG: TOBE domain-containing protein, partial [Pseudomonadota bacterium]
FLFDEPLSNLDAKLRGQMRAELALMRQSVQKNMIYVTHDQVEAMTLADRIVVMHGGHIQQQGTPEELFKRPANKFVAGFLGMPPMNFLGGTVADRDGGIFIEGAGFALRLADDKAAAVRAHGKGAVILGVRPSDLLFEPEAPAERALTLQVRVCEYIGAQSVLLCSCGPDTVTVEVKSETPLALGETLTFSVDPARMHLFDQESEVAL